MSGESSPEARLQQLGLVIGRAPSPAANYVPVRRYGSVVTTASISAKRGDQPRFLGRLGEELNVDEGRESARAALINCLAVVRAEIGSLDLVDHVVRITGYVASAPGFTDQHRVMDGACDLACELFGDAGRHVRAAIGVAALPNNCSVAVELTVVVRGQDG